jgi:serine/threonine protein kinase
LPQFSRSHFDAGSRAMENSEKDADRLSDGWATSDGPTPTSKPALAPDQKVGEYVLIGKLGAGGIGEVWKARDGRLNRIVALKFMATQRPGSSPPADLLREARAASALNHPNIITIFEAGESQGAAYLAMEFIEGETLRARMKRSPVPLAEALDIAIQITQGLAAAHRAGIIHRDLKPENVMLRADGYVKLLDFGLAKVLPGAQPETAGLSPASTTTESGMIVGTLTYLSPEQARGLKAGPASDVFSFGILFYELLTGEHPFRAETPMDTLAAILANEPPNAHAHSPSVPPAISDICTRALSKDPSRRFESAVELAAELRRAREAEPGAATPRVSVVRSKPRWMQAVGVALIALLLGLAGWRYHASSSEAGGAPVRSVAVMTFRTTPDDAQATTLAQDLPEEVEAALSGTGLQVASQSGVLQLGSVGDARTLGAQLGVDAVMDGSVRSFGPRFKIHVELVNTRTGFQVWSDSFTTENGDLLAEEQRVAKQIAQELQQAIAK